MKRVITLRDVLLSELKDLYSAEHQLLAVLPQIENRATNQKLRAAIHSHFLETARHTNRLEEIGVLMRAPLSEKASVSMKGLLIEAKEALTTESEDDALVDLLLIGAMKRIEHYEMAAYSTVRAMSLELGEHEIADLLKESLDEELNMDEILSWIAGEEVLLTAHAQPTFREEKEMSALFNDIPIREIPIRSKRLQQATRMLGLFVTLIALISASPGGARADHHEQGMAVSNEKSAAGHKPDDTGRNVRDKNGNHVTADDQKLSGQDIEILARLRSEIVANKGLSSNGHNVKIIVEKQKVTLRGPVDSAAERTWIHETVARIAKGYSVVNNLEVVAR